jgi:hypothetical protein
VVPGTGIAAKMSQMMPATRLELAHSRFWAGTDASTGEEGFVNGWNG